MIHFKLLQYLYVIYFKRLVFSWINASKKMILKRGQNNFKFFYALKDVYRKKSTSQYDISL